MFSVGDRVKIISIEKGVSSEFLNRTGTIIKVSPKEYYMYYVEFDDILLKDKARYMWWTEENLAIVSGETGDMEEKNKELLCLRCNSPMNYLKEYMLDSQDNNRGLLGSFFDYEENLIFKVYVCPKCRHTEFFYTGKREGLDDWIDL